MKKINALLPASLAAVVTALFVSVVLTSCSSPLNEKEAPAQAKQEQDAIAAPKSNLSKTYGRIVDLQLDYAQRGMETVQEYIDIPNSARSAGKTTIDFADVGAYLPDDLTSLKRIKKGSSRSLAGDSAEEEVSLGEELNALTDQFSMEFQDALPNPEKALTLSFVTGTDEGLLIGDDSLIPYNSLQGAITVEVLNALAAGEDVTQLLASFENEMQEAIEGDDENSRALIKNSTVTWSQGVLNYRWGDISESHKNAVQTAMNTWKTKTGGKVSFNELSDSGWNNFQVGIHAIGVIKIYDVDTTSFEGQATVGYYSGDSPHLKLRRGINTPDALERVPLHELGHCIGLMHEHQREDRDSSIIVSQSGSNYEKIPLFLQEWRIYWARIRIGFWTISIPIGFGYEYLPNSSVSGSFDFNSIMLYADFPLKKDASLRTAYNKELSSDDIAAVKRLY
jgi:hypothetical protein